MKRNMTQNHPTLVFTDSRGRNLQSYLDTSDFHVIFFPGAKLRNIVQYAEPYVTDLCPANILFIGGTCDLTVRQRISRHIRPRFSTSEQLLNHMLEVLFFAHDLASNLFPNIPIAFGGLCGVHLNMYNNQPGSHTMQSVIDQMIDQFNYEVKLLNIRCGIIHPTITSKIHKRSRLRGNRNHYQLLSDGVHPGQAVLRDWARNLVKFRLNNTV